MRRTGNTRDNTILAADRALLKQARDGDPVAYEAVVATRLPGAYRLAHAILGPDRDPDDATSCALAAAWHELPRLDDVARFDDWLDRIVICECRMRLGGGPDAGGRRGADVPPDLLDRTMRAVNERRQAPLPRARWRTAMVGLAFAVPILAFGLVMFAAFGGFRGSGAFGGPGSDAAGPSPSLTGDPGVAGAPGGAPTPSGTTPPSTGESPGPGLGVGILAVVTLEGDNLRVRTTPGTGDPKTRLKPVLPAGTRMLIVDGPVPVDDLDWYEIRTDGELIDLFGWVAAGDNGEAWIAPAAPRCWGDLDAATVVGLDRIDFLACYGQTKVKVQARASGLWDVRQHEGECGWLPARGACEVDNAWLLLPAARVTLISEGRAEYEVALAMPPDLSEALAKLPRQATLLLTVSMDAPESTGCRARDAASGQALVPDERAVLECRIQFVIQEIAYPAGEPSPEPPSN